MPEAPTSGRQDHPGFPVAGISTATLAVGLLIAAILGAGGFFLNRRLAANHEEFRNSLRAVADLKVSQLSRWRADRMSEGRFLSAIPDVSRDAAVFIKGPASEDSRSALAAWGRLSTENFAEVSFYDARRDSLTLLSPRGHAAPPHALKTLAEVTRAGEPALIDLHRDLPSEVPHLELVCPIRGPGGAGAEGRAPVCALVLGIDPRKFLFPMIQNWPTPSRTAETLLVRRDGDQLVFLNKLRHREGAPLALRLAIDPAGNLPAAMAALGREGMVEGRDYRGEPVLADIRAVPGSPWFMVAKVDEAELRGPMWTEAWVVIGLTAAAALAAWLLLRLVQSRREATLVRQELAARRRAEEALRASEQELRTRDLAISGAASPMAMFDSGGRLNYANRSFLRLWGCPDADSAVGRSIADFWLHPGEPARTLAILTEKDAWTGELTARRGNGIVFRVEAVVSTVRDAGGKTICLLASFTDLSERRRAADEREATVNLLRLLNASNDLHELMRSVTLFFQSRFECEAVGIRLKDGDDYPYFETRGFPPEFIQAENKLCATDLAGQVRRDEAGSPVLDCMCGNILCGRFDPSKPFFTTHGSFWSNCTTELLASTSEADRQTRTRNRCNGEGYESVALVPLRFAGNTFGLLQLNDRRRNLFAPERVAFAERLCDSLAIALDQRLARRALEAEAARRQALLAAIPDIVMEVDANKVYTWANPAGKTFFGDDVVGREAACYFEGGQRTYEIVQPLFDGDEKVIYVESWQRRRDGQKRLLAWWCRVLKDSSGRVKGALSSARDITERRRAEEELQRSERRYRDLYLGITDAVYVHLVADNRLPGRIVEANEAACRMLGYSRDELQGMSVTQIDAPDSGVDRGAVIDQLRAGRDVLFEQIHVAKDGRRVPVEIHVRPCEYAGQPAILSLVRDVSERRRLERKIEESGQRMELAARSASLGIWDWDVAGNRMTWDDQMFRLYGIAERPAAYGVEIWENGLHPDDRARVLAACQAALRGEAPYNIEFRVRHPDGKVRHIKADGTVIRDDAGRPVRMLGVNYDITGRKLAEERIRSDLEEKEILLREIHHRVKNNLQTISSLLGLQSSALANSEASAAMEQCRDRILAMARAYEGLYRTDDFRAIRIAPYLRNVIDMLCQAYGVGRKHVRTDLADLTVSLDTASSCGMIVNELLTNAFKYAFPPDWPGTVQVTLRPLDAGMELTVRDDGVGLPENGAGRGQGSLGLNLVSMLVRQLKGGIAVDRGSGTCFRMMLPTGRREKE